MKKKTMRQLRMASSQKEEGWHLLHHLLHLLFQHQRRLHHQLPFQHCLLPQLQHRRFKQYLWRLRFPWLRLLGPTSWRTLRVPPHHSYPLERVLLQPPRSPKPRQVGMRVLTTRPSSSPSPPRLHHAKKLPINNQSKRAVVRASTRLLQRLHHQRLPTFPLRLKGCGNPSQQNSK